MKERSWNESISRLDLANLEGGSAFEFAGYPDLIIEIGFVCGKATLNELPQPDRHSGSITGTT